MPSNERELTLHRLEGDGLIILEDGATRTTQRWQGAMARAALHPYAAGDSGEDLRTPIAKALLSLYGSVLSAHELACCVETMLPVEARALGLSTDRQRVVG